MKETQAVKRSFTLSMPSQESQAVLEAAKRLNVSITMIFRMLVRKALLDDPIIFPEKE